MAARVSSSDGIASESRTPSRNMKIAVVGGGAAGLSAAYLLKKAGYSHVTVFEKDSRLGGKCKTVMLNGRSYELGAVVHRSGAEPLESFIREFKLELVPGIARRPRGTPILFDPHRGSRRRHLFLAKLERPLPDRAGPLAQHFL